MTSHLLQKILTMTLRRRFIRLLRHEEGTWLIQDHTAWIYIWKTQSPCFQNSPSSWGIKWLLSSLPVLKFCTHTHSHNDYKVILGSFKTVLATLLCLLLHTDSSACILWLGVQHPHWPSCPEQKAAIIFDSYPILLPFLVFIKPYKSHLVNISSPSKSVHLSCYRPSSDFLISWLFYLASQYILLLSSILSSFTEKQAF